MKRKICSNETQENGFCTLHLNSYQKVIEKFNVWREASTILWGDYLVGIQKNSLTGEWAKDVVKHLIKEEWECQVK